MAGSLPLPTKEFNENFDWIVEHFPDLVMQHPNCWIAVDKRHVLASDPDLGIVRKSVSGRAQPGEVVFYFVDDGSLIFPII